MITRKAIFIVLCTAVLTLLLCAQAVAGWSNWKGIPGDCNGSGAVDIDDVVSQIGWIFNYDPDPPTLWDCDCDGTLGINIGDVYYLIAYIFQGGSTPVVPDIPGDYIPPGPDELFRLSGIDPTTCQMEISVKTPPGHDIVAVELPFTYIEAIGEWDPPPYNIHVLDVVYEEPYDHGGLTYQDWDGFYFFVIRNDFSAIPPPVTTVIPSTNGVYNKLCTVTFEADGYPRDNKEGERANPRVKLRPHTDDRVSPLYIATNDKGENVLTRPDFRTYIYGIQGDANCSGGIDIDDVVYLICYIFQGCPEPCDEEEWIGLFGF